MKRLRLWLCLTCFLVGLSLLSQVVAQQEHEVRMIIEEVEGRPLPEFYFEPTGLYIEPGDTVIFIAESPHHTATAYHAQHGKPQRVPEGVEPFSSPVVAIGERWEYTFDTPGVYDLWCAPHEQYGMVMRIVVGEATGPGTEPPADFGPLGTFGAAGVVLSHPALDPENIIDAGSVSWDEVRPEVEGALQAPEGEEEGEPGDEDETDEEEGEEGN